MVDYYRCPPRRFLAGLLLLLDCLSQFSVFVNADLRQIWNFSAPALRDPKLDPNGLRINILYEVSDYILPEMVMYNIRDWDCQFNVSEWFVPTLISPPSNWTQGDGSGDGIIEVEVNIDPQSFFDADLPENATTFWDGYQDKYRVMFCIQTGVQTRSNPPILVDSSETQIMVTYDLTDGFNIELEVTPFMDNITAEEGIGVDAIFCDAGVELNDEQIKALGIRGSELEVCVFPDNETQAKGYYDMDKILDFSWTRKDGDGPEVAQVAIVNGSPAGNGLTEVECNPTGCAFRSILKADFFQDEIPTTSPTQAPTEIPSGSPTYAPTRWFPPGTTELDEGYCIDNEGNRYDWYQANPFGSTMSECSTQASDVHIKLQSLGYMAQVRAMEYDDVGCRILVDGGSGGPALTGYDFFNSPSGTSAVSPVVDSVPQIGERCLMYSAQSYNNYVSPPYVQGSANGIGQGTCSNTAGDSTTGVLAFYDIDQMIGTNTNSCNKLCYDVTGTFGFLGITIIRDESTNVQGNSPPPAYTGTGNFLCLCHLLLNGPSDSRITAAQNFQYPSGKGFYYADSTGTAVNLGGTDTSNPNAYCYLYHPLSIEFVTGSHCADSAGNLYDYYSPQSGGGGSVAIFEGPSIVTNCPETCQEFAESMLDYVEQVRGYEYDETGCRCLVDSGYGDRGITGFSHYSAASGTTSAVSMILSGDTGSLDQTSCYRHISERYAFTDYFTGTATSINVGECTDSNNQNIPYVEFWDVNQITGSRVTSCQQICDGAFGNGGYIGITIIRDLDTPVPTNPLLPYTAGTNGIYTCRCHVVFEDDSDARVVAAQTLELSSGQTYKDAVGSADDAAYSGTAVGGSTSNSADGYCYVKNPSSLRYVGEGRCVDGGNNAYDYYQKDLAVITDCQNECQTLSDENFQSALEQMRGMEWDSTNCRCLVDSGYGDRNIAGWTFVSASTATSAISPIIDYDGTATGWGCYEHLYTAFNKYNPGGLGYPYAIGSGYCVDSNQDPLDSVNIFDANQMKQYDRDSCHQLCKDVVNDNNAYLGFTIYRDPNAASGYTDPYTPAGSGDYHCKCHVNLSGAADPSVIRGQNLGNVLDTPTGDYFTGQGYRDYEDVSISTNADIYTRIYAPNQYCYRWDGRRRQLLQNNITDGSVGTSNNDGISISNEVKALNLPNTDANKILESFKYISEGYETGKKLRGQAFEEEQAEERNLQAVDRPIIISGSGLALLKLRTSVARRNLATGEFEWTTGTRSVVRKLQVDGGGARFDLELGLVPERFGPSYGTSDDAGKSSSWLWSAGAFFVALACLTMVILVWIAFRKNREEEEKE